MNIKLKFLIFFFTLFQRQVYSKFDGDVGFGSGIVDTRDEDLGVSNSLIEDVQQQMKDIRGNSNDKELQEKDFKLTDVNIDIDQILQDLEHYNCLNKKKKKNKELCERHLGQLAFDVIGEYGGNSNDFYHKLKKYIYEPLGMKMDAKPDLSGILGDITSLSTRSSIFDGQPLMTNYDSFKEVIQNQFREVLAKASDESAFNEATSELSISMLKKFHIYWNSLRYKGLMHKSLKDTKQILKDIQDTYSKHQSFLKQIVEVMLQKIKQRYYQFLLAHRSIKYVKKKGLSFIAEKIVLRFDQDCNEIKYNRFDNIKFLHEICTILDIYDAYNINAYRSGWTQQKILFQTQTVIIERIVEIWSNYNNLIKDENRREMETLKHFTALLVLKMKHHNFVTFYFHSISEQANLPQINVYSEHKTTVKVYYEVKDIMSILPRNCIHFLLLKNCAIYETNKMIAHISSKYMLKRSIAGWGVFDYLMDNFRYLFRKADNMVWSNYTLFKNYYYQNLFAIILNMKKYFLIKDDDTIESLEENLSKVIQAIRQDSSQGTINYGLIDEFDQQIYERFLEIKATFNINQPIKNDGQILNRIQNELLEFLSDYHEQYIKDMDNAFRAMLIQISQIIKAWVKYNLENKYEEVIEIQEKPLNQRNEYPQVFHELKAENDQKQNKSGNDLVTKSIEKDPQEELEKLKNDLKIDLNPIPMKNSFAANLSQNSDLGTDTGLAMLETPFESIGT